MNLLLQKETVRYTWSSQAFILMQFRWQDAAVLELAEWQLSEVKMAKEQGMIHGGHIGRYQGNWDVGGGRQAEKDSYVEYCWLIHELWWTLELCKWMPK